MEENMDILYPTEENKSDSSYEIVICDDDNIFCFQLEDYLLQYCRDYDIPINVHIFHNGLHLKEFIADGKHVDLLFLDINLSDDENDGVTIGTFVRNLPEMELTQIVYISSGSQYAMQLFRIRPLDFLIKPITQEMVDRIMETYARLFIQTNTFFKYNIKKKECHVEVHSIIYFQSIAKRIRIVTKHGEIEYYGKLSDALAHLPENLFLCVHKSYVVNMSFVSEYRVDEIILSDGTSIPVSQSKRGALHEYMRNMDNRKTNQ